MFPSIWSGWFLWRHHGYLSYSIPQKQYCGGIHFAKGRYGRVLGTGNPAGTLGEWRIRIRSRVQNLLDRRCDLLPQR